MAEANAAADADPSVLRVSIDSKAKVNVGNLSRGGKDRRQQPPKADDHDMEWQQVLTPFGILNLHTDELSIYLGESAETPDFIVDCLAHWWEDNRPQHPEVTTLAINLDGGSAIRSDHTQFILVETTLQWASNMMWKGMQPVVCQMTDVYEKGIKVDRETLATFRVDWHPSEDLPNWAITINPA